MVPLQSTSKTFIRARSRVAHSSPLAAKVAPPLLRPPGDERLNRGNSGLRCRLIGYSLYAQYLLYGRDE
jgi:hypothetical protein